MEAAADSLVSRCLMSPGSLQKAFLVVSLVSISLLGTDLEYLIKLLIFNLDTFEYMPVKQCPPLLAIEDYAKDGGTGVVRPSCSFYHGPLRY